MDGSADTTTSTLPDATKAVGGVLSANAAESTVSMETKLGTSSSFFTSTGETRHGFFGEERLESAGWRERWLPGFLLAVVCKHELS